jgi:hypothetical protein
MPISLITSNRSLRPSVSVVFSVMLHIHTYTDALEKLSLQSLRKRRHHLDAMFLFRSIVALNPSLRFWKMLAFVFLPTICGISPLFGVCPSNKQCPSARCACAANVVGKDSQLEQFLSITFMRINIKLLIIFVHDHIVLCYVVLVTSHLRLLVYFSALMCFSFSTNQ